MDGKPKGEIRKMIKAGRERMKKRKKRECSEIIESGREGIEEYEKRK